MSDLIPSGNATATSSSHPHAEAPVKSVSRVTLVFGLWLAVALAYWPSSLALAHLWVNTAEEAYTHGFLILLICLWFVVRERRSLAAAPLEPLPQALIPLLLLSLMWLWAWRAAVQELHLMLLPAILYVAIIAALGWRAARILAFPVGYLYFALPFWSDANFILQKLSAKMTGVLVWLAGVPAFMQGDVIHLPAGSIHIAGGCSGLHSFIVGLALATLYCKLCRFTPRRTAVALALMAALTMIVNWVRIFIVTFAAYLTDMQTSLVRNHYWLGWWLFAATFVGFLWWIDRKPHTRAPSAAAPDSQHPGAQRSAVPRFGVARYLAAVVALAALIVTAAAYATDSQDAYLRTDYWLGWCLCALALASALWWMGRQRVARAPADAASSEGATALPARGMGLTQLVATLLALAILPATAYGIDWADSGVNAAVAIEWPPAPPGWQGPSRAYASAWQPQFVGATGESLRQYTDDRGNTLQVFAVAYRVQSQHAKLVGYWNTLLGTTHMLHVLSQRLVSTTTGPWRELQVSSLSGNRSLIWSRYRIGQRTFVEPRTSQLWYGLAALIDPPMSSLTAFRSGCVPDCAAARARLADAVRELRPTLH
jgi:EpsI family protein